MKLKKKTINVTEQTWKDLKHLQLYANLPTLTDTINLLVLCYRQAKGIE